MARRRRPARSSIASPPARSRRRFSARWIYVGIMVALAVVLIITMAPPPF